MISRASVWLKNLIDNKRYVPELGEYGDLDSTDRQEDDESADHVILKEDVWLSQVWPLKISISERQTKIEFSLHNAVMLAVNMHPKTDSK